MLNNIVVFFAHASAVVFAILTLVWLISVIRKDASLVDIFWGFGFLIVGSVCLYISQSISNFALILAALPIIWGLRLTVYLAKRNLGHGEDKRYIDMRVRAQKQGMSEFAWRLRSLFTVYWGQGLLIMIVSAPIWVGLAQATHNKTSVPEVLGIWGGLGLTIWLTGFLFETVSDAQLARFLKTTQSYTGPIEQKPVLDRGLWKYTRHPNYFGNACMWWGIWLVACEAPLGFYTVFSPIIMTLLLTKVSGRDLLERSMRKRPAYQEYMSRTSSFLPVPPQKRKD